MDLSNVGRKNSKCLLTKLNLKTTKKNAKCLQFKGEKNAKRNESYKVISNV